MFNFGKQPVSVSVSAPDMAMFDAGDPIPQQEPPRLSRAVQQLRLYMNSHRVRPFQDKTVKPFSADITANSFVPAAVLRNRANTKESAMQKKALLQAETIKVYGKAKKFIAQQKSSKPNIIVNSLTDDCQEQQAPFKPDTTDDNVDGEQDGTLGDNAREEQDPVQQEEIASMTPSAIQRTSPAVTPTTSSGKSFTTILDTIKEAHEEHEGGHRVCDRVSDDTTTIALNYTSAIKNSSHFRVRDHQSKMVDSAYLSAAYRKHVKYAAMVTSHTAPAISSYKPLSYQQKDWNRTRYDMDIDAEIESEAEAFIQRLERTFLSASPLTLPVPPDDFENDADSSSYFDSDDDYMPQTPADDFNGAQTPEKVPHVEKNGDVIQDELVAAKSVVEDDILTEVSSSCAGTVNSPAPEIKNPQGDILMPLNDAIRKYVPKVPAKTLTQCKVNRIINHASSEDHMYELYIQVNHDPIAIYNGVMRKLTNSSSADTLAREPITFENLNWPFIFHVGVTGKKCTKSNKATRIRQTLTQFNTWQQEVFTSLKRSASFLKSHKLTNANGDNDDINTVTTLGADFSKYQEPPHHYPILGQTYQLFDNFHKRHVMNQEHSLSLYCHKQRFGSARWRRNIEVSLTFSEKEVVPFISRLPPSPLQQDESAVVGGSSVANRVLDRLSNIRIAKSHCERGDYLTFYTKGSIVPLWVRYWVVLRGAYLVVYDFGFKAERNPVTVIPLTPLLSVEKSHLDDCEVYGLVRSTSFTLNFNKGSAVLSNKRKQDDADNVLNAADMLTDNLKLVNECSKLFIHCDDERSSTYWRIAISDTLKDLPNNVSSTEGVEAALLW